jgi:hypothetical protein
MGRHWGKGRQRAQRHLDNLAQRPARTSRSFSPGRCPHKVTVWRDGLAVELSCKVKAPHTEHRHGDHTWT